MISGHKNLRYFTFGERRYGSQPIFGKKRNMWEFEFILEGYAHPSGVQTPVIADPLPRLYISHPHSEHGWTDDQDSTSEVVVLHFYEVPEELKDRIEPTKPLLIELDQPTLDRFSPMLQSLREQANNADALSSLNMLSILIELCKLALNNISRFTLPSDSLDKVSRTLHWFEENLGRSPSVEDAARSVGVSTAHLRRLFAEANRPSPKSELVRLQIEAAQRGLLEGWTQKAIAAFLGYSEPSTFARAFRDACGQPPGSWLKQRQREIITSKTSKAK
ncbi:AraC family transcriptional regulator [Coraliomargarita sp. SDUM461004]|uniref:AraC family transcriptional regulator n=1 Tax=Thalassobacterium sedimentorum TaxID=3041258 RepID=A0ABU1AEF7_9BACT|nr:AraC family transcriptional regulator [Coraliomargarita sp. SDUM461004]MDQ8192874.1 AraC family transcriptional regulator [Coraliomargarita sp. SDUM461004]